MYHLDVTLNNKTLFSGCQVVEANGRLQLRTPPDEASRIIRRNVERLLVGVDDRGALTIDGPVPAWIGMVVYHAAAHRFSRVYYHDGQSLPICLTAHG